MGELRDANSKGLKAMPNRQMAHESSHVSVTANGPHTQCISPSVALPKIPFSNEQLLLYNKNK